ncbi:MAG: hypothetical protein K6C94_00800 [Candidatus Gastranaerophilales bacterium]|nr:hypothetical protein [Candidatus Gastranaerophilales bacterium]
MASVADSIRTLFGAKLWLIKLSIMAALIVYPAYQMIANFDGWQSTMAYITYGLGTFYLGYLLLISHNLINEKPIILPGFFNPFKIFFVGLGAIIALGPMVLLMVYVGVCLNQILVNMAMPNYACITTVVFAEMFLLGILTVQMTLYTTKLNPFYAYHLIKILKTFLDFAFKAIPLFVILLLFSGVVLYPIGVLAEKMFSAQSMPFYFYISFCVTFLLIVSVMFYSQLCMENLVLFDIDDDDTVGDMMDKKLIKENDELKKEAKEREKILKAKAKKAKKSKK